MEPEFIEPNYLIAFILTVIALGVFTLLLRYRELIPIIPFLWIGSIMLFQGADCFYTGNCHTLEYQKWLHECNKTSGVFAERVAFVLNGSIDNFYDYEPLEVNIQDCHIDVHKVFVGEFEKYVESQHPRFNELKLLHMVHEPLPKLICLRIMSGNLLEYHKYIQSSVVRVCSS